MTLTTRTAVMLMLTFSSCLFRESTLLVSGWITTGNGVIRRNHISCLTAGAKATQSGDRVRLFASAFQKEGISPINSNILSDARNRNRNRSRSNIHRHKSRNSQKIIGIRNLATNLRVDEQEHQGEYDIKNNNNYERNNNNNERSDKNRASSSSSNNSARKETVVNDLSIDPEDVVIYERTDENENEKVLSSDKNENYNTNNLSTSNPFGDRNFIEMFRGSANYISSHRNTLAVFHIPGDLMDENPAGFRDLMNDISLSWLLGMKIVIVAGCRYQINKRHKENSQGRQEHMGMVVTDPESLRVVKEEAGYVRFEIERQLARALQSGSSSNKRSSNGNGNGNGSDGGDAGEGNVVSGNFYSAQPFGVLDGVDYQYSGFVRRMETHKIHQVHQNRDIVLLTSLGFSPTGEVFNVNSEYLAAYAAGSLGASKIIYFLEKNAALRHKIHGSIIPHLRVNDGRNLLDLNGLRTEKKGFVYLDDCPFDYGAEQLFLVKMGWGMNALEAGVKRVHLISPYDGALLQELYTRDGSGTMISGDLYDGIQGATVDDVTAIYEVVTPLVEKGILVDRTKAELERDIDQYHVYTRDGLLVACGQLKMFENGYAEFGCLVVNPLYRAKGRGDAMLGYLERLCVQAGATNLFVLSTQTMEWFVERGFDEVGVDMLPPSRQATYNHDRGSKIYFKKVNSVRDLDASELFWDR